MTFADGTTVGASTAILRSADSHRRFMTRADDQLPPSTIPDCALRTRTTRAVERLRRLTPLGNRSNSVYDTAARVVASIDPLNKRTTTVYHTASQSLATLDANGNRHSFTYELTGALTQLIDPLNHRTTLAYDAADRQNLRIDARGSRTTHAYRTVGQLTSRRYTDGTRATFSYDTIGNLTLMADSTGRYTSTFDAVDKQHCRHSWLDSAQLGYLTSTKRQRVSTSRLIHSLALRARIL